ncbi:DUF1152 domain-containing protein [Streptomyces sp. PsTaAH-124]|uniref:DUF1152 domain-containing protein n=1 Tax=Streptomyces sp. PsTaAH-124 TaxID=1157638 RepID=UPI000476211D|nr:DUF1152 domain-containing protein [Streptomyces sp. PsTaAH-124]
MKRLLLAAGGGGDAITTAMVHAALHGPDEPALILTYAWERLVVDPVPGPRRPSDFTGTVPAGPTLRLVTPDSAPRPPAGSLLPRLAADLRTELGLLDPYGGAVGLARQITEAAAYCGADHVDVVDVGGDVLADGTEPTLRSPLGDALALAACAHASLSTSVHIAGPGLDSEVPEATLLPTLGAPLRTLTAADTQVVERVFDWHPSEASALLVAAARGIRGICGTRDAPEPVTLTDASPGIYRLTLTRALQLNPLARALADTTDLDAAERASLQVCGFSEIARERARAAAPHQDTPSPRPSDGNIPLPERFAHWEQSTARRGITYVTTRRITEELALLPPQSAELRAHLLATSPPRQAPPLWRLYPTER